MKPRHHGLTCRWCGDPATDVLRAHVREDVGICDRAPYCVEVIEVRDDSDMSMRDLAEAGDLVGIDAELFAELAARRP